ncbi:CaiB/BaiF CoA-transferase family protein [Aquibium sp. LZ166]|uniref:CaiB/BaiF CoA-transferase family protein n=1 Tax=Aquibium pacificus TaxID=3153579 RepID=A0ABV3SKK5_9HYPH
MLEGIRVIEMANVISGPFAGMLLADMGAEVIKVEMPGGGDPFRMWSASQSEISPAFAAYNRGKKSVTIDIKSAEGRAAYLKLAASGDVVIDNFRPGTLDRAGIGCEVLRVTAPSLIYCAVSGLGHVGPDRDRPTYDAIAQAMSGLWSQLTDLDAPQPVGPPMSDQLTGLYAANAVLGALVARGRNGGVGQRLDVSMLGASIAFQPHAVAEFLSSGKIADKLSRAYNSQSYAFVASDGRPFAVHLSSLPKFWKALLVAVARPELEEDPRFATKQARGANYEELHSVLQAIFATAPRAVWLATLQAEDVPCGPIHTIGEALEDPQVRALEMTRSFGSGDRATQLVGYGFAASGGQPEGTGRPVPKLGEHTEAVLAECGYDKEAVAALRRASAV